MKRFLCKILPTPDKSSTLSESESRHARLVLRLEEGTEVLAMDGKGGVVPAKVKILSEQVSLAWIPTRSDFDQQVEALRSLQILPLNLWISIPKAKAMDWIVEKSVELGVTRLQPMISSHTVVKITGKPPEVFQSRWQRSADQALKQCGRLDSLTVEPPKPMDQLLKKVGTRPGTIFFSDEALGPEPTTSLDVTLHTLNPPGPFTLVIGPEGGWSEAERRTWISLSEKYPKQVLRISLGPLILRAETAALVGSALLATHLRAQMKFSPEPDKR